MYVCVCVCLRVRACVRVWIRASLSCKFIRRIISTNGSILTIVTVLSSISRFTASHTLTSHVVTGHSIPAMAAGKFTFRSIWRIGALCFKKEKPLWQYENVHLMAYFCPVFPYQLHPNAKRIWYKCNLNIFIVTCNFSLSTHNFLFAFAICIG